MMLVASQPLHCLSGLRVGADPAPRMANSLGVVLYCELGHGLSCSRSPRAFTLFPAASLNPHSKAGDKLRLEERERRGAGAWKVTGKQPSERNSQRTSEWAPAGSRGQDSSQSKGHFVPCRSWGASTFGNS